MASRDKHKGVSHTPPDPSPLLLRQFRFTVVRAQPLPGTSDTSSPLWSRRGVMCTRYSDQEYLDKRCVRASCPTPRSVPSVNSSTHGRCKGSREELYQRYGRHGVDRIWRDDILPCRVYLRHCVLAAQGLGKEAEDSFLDHTYLGDRGTTIREHLARDLSIMKELPPPELKERYSG